MTMEHVREVHEIDKTTSFGESVHDRRYKEKCVVNGSIDNALKILHELERAR